MNNKRKQVQEYVIKYIRKLDSGLTRNVTRYEQMFKSMSDSEFDTWMHALKNKTAKLDLVVPNGFKDTLRVNAIIDTAEEIGCEFMESIKLYDDVTGRYFTTPYKYCILQLPIRRLKQHLTSKMSIPESDKKLNALTGQVVKPDKGAAISITEAQAIASKGLMHTLSELLTVRGGNIDAYALLKSQLSELGKGDLKTLNINKSDVRSVKVTSAYLQAMHLDNTL